MAVAPELPVAQLYHLIVERKGHFEAAERDAIRVSQRQSTLALPAKQLSQARAAIAPLTAPIHNKNDAEDEPYIKIDLDDPIFMWDDDAPATPLPEPRRPKQHSQTRQKKPIPKTTTKPTKSSSNTARPSRPASSQAQSPTSTEPHLPSTYKAPSMKDTRFVRKPEHTEKPRKNSVVKSSGRGARDINRGMRETSYDRTFIVSDDEVLENSDDTYSESDDGAALDIDMTDDGTDLTIDMEPEYAYNSGILSSPSVR